MLEYIDTHAHIYLDHFNEDLPEIIERAHEASVNEIYMPNIDHTSIDDMLEVEHKYSQCIAMMGLHPCSVNKDFEKELYLVEDWLAKREFVAVGEIGTDLYWDKTYWEQQQEAFKIQVGWAKKYKLPIVIHCRESLDETIELVEQLKDEDLTGVFHCFGGSVEQAKRITDLGFYIGIGGVATFKNGGMDKVIPSLDIDTLVLETDSPYLTPAPHRGKRNEPSYVALVGEKVAEYMKKEVEEVGKATSLNARKLYKQI